MEKFEFSKRTRQFMSNLGIAKLKDKPHMIMEPVHAVVGPWKPSPGSTCITTSDYGIIYDEFTELSLYPNHRVQLSPSANTVRALKKLSQKSLSQETLEPTNERNGLMTNNSDNAWDSLRKEIQKKISNLKTKELDPSYTDMEQASFAAQSRLAIHRALGMRTGDPNRLNSQLKELLWQYEGGIYESIRKYLSDYDIIEVNAIISAKKQLEEDKTKSSSRSL